MDFKKRNYYAEFIQEEIDFYLKEANFDSRERLHYVHVKIIEHICQLCIFG